MTAIHDTAGKTADESGLRRKQGLVAAGGIIGAVAASSCCILPLVLFSLGVGGVWIGQLTALAPYQPFFLAITVGVLGYGFWTTYRAPACEEGDVCGRPLPSRIVRAALWSATGLVVLAIAWPYVVPILLD